MDIYEVLHALVHHAVHPDDGFLTDNHDEAHAAIDAHAAAAAEPAADGADKPAEPAEEHF
jgi:hypothetical protein